MRNPITIVIAVYGDWSSLEQNLLALLQVRGWFPRSSVLLINDQGPEADSMEDGIIRLVGHKKGFRYVRNSSNLGFVKTCNRAAFELSDPGSDLLFLNSDTIPTKGFLWQLASVLYSEKNIGAVCPRSNAATIFSVPMRQDRPYTMEESYAEYRRIRTKLPVRYLSPIAHGFCLLVRREVVETLGLFDEVYGKGYGEENDFCMRIRRAGWSCAVANRAYVFHHRTRSFTPESRAAQIEVNERILDNRYPEYRGLVQEYWDSIQEPR